VTINPLGCRPSSAEHESNRSKTHDSYTTCWGTIAEKTGAIHESQFAAAQMISPERRHRTLLEKLLTLDISRLMGALTSGAAP